MMKKDEQIMQVKRKDKVREHRIDFLTARAANWGPFDTG